MSALWLDMDRDRDRETEADREWREAKKHKQHFKRKLPDQSLWKIENSINVNAWFSVSDLLMKYQYNRQHPWHFNFMHDPMSFWCSDFINIIIHETAVSSKVQNKYVHTFFFDARKPNGWCEFQCITFGIKSCSPLTCVG